MRWANNFLFCQSDNCDSSYLKSMKNSFFVLRLFLLLTKVSVSLNQVHIVADRHFFTFSCFFPVPFDVSTVVRRWCRHGGRRRHRYPHSPSVYSGRKSQIFVTFQILLKLRRNIRFPVPRTWRSEGKLIDLWHSPSSPWVSTWTWTSLIILTLLLFRFGIGYLFCNPTILSARKQQHFYP